MEVNKDKLKLALKIASESPDVNVEYLMELITPQIDNDMVLTRKLAENENHFKRWTEKEDKLLLELRQQGKTIREISKALGRTESSINLRINKLKIEKNNVPTIQGHNVRWTDEENQKLIELVLLGYKTRNIAAKLNRSYESTRRKILQLKNNGGLTVIQTDNTNTNETESYKHRKIRELLERHRNNMDSVQPLEYTQLAKELYMNRDECISMVYDVWKGEIA